MRYLLFLLMTVLTTLVTEAQSMRLNPNENSVVQDSSGTIFPYLVWHNLMKSGNYKLIPVDPKNVQTTYILAKRSEKEKDEFMNRIARPKESVFFTNGKEISLFKTKDIAGNKIDLKDSKGKIIVLNFWFINCPPCRREIPELNEMVEQFKGNDKVVFMAVALDDKYSIQEFLKTNPFLYSIVDNGRYLTDRYGVKSYPTHLIVDMEGKVYFHTTGLGLNTVHWLKKSINELLDKNAKNPLSGGEQQL